MARRNPEIGPGRRPRNDKLQWTDIDQGHYVANSERENGQYNVRFDKYKTNRWKLYFVFFGSDDKFDLPESLFDSFGDASKAADVFERTLSPEWFEGNAVRTTGPYRHASVESYRKGRPARRNPDEPTLKWTPHVDGKVYGASGKVTLSSGRVVEVSLRVDAREEGNVRVDKATIGPWNAIDDGEGFSTVGEAQRFAKAWLRAAQTEGTLDPRVPRNIRDMGSLEGVFTRKNPKRPRDMGQSTWPSAVGTRRDSEGLTLIERTMRRSQGATEPYEELLTLLKALSTPQRAKAAQALRKAADYADAPDHLRGVFKPVTVGGVRVSVRGSTVDIAPAAGGDRMSKWADGAREVADMLERTPRKNPDDTLDSCTRQYLETAMWASTDDNDVPLDEEFSITDFPSSEIEKARKVCDDFCDNNDVSEIENDQVGHYLWLSRNGHGAGFFDIDRDDLQKAARKLGEVDIYVGDDGLLYFSR